MITFYFIFAPILLAAATKSSSKSNYITYFPNGLMPQLNAHVPQHLEQIKKCYPGTVYSPIYNKCLALAEPLSMLPLAGGWSASLAGSLTGPENSPGSLVRLLSAALSAAFPTLSPTVLQAITAALGGLSSGPLAALLAALNTATDPSLTGGLGAGLAGLFDPSLLATIASGNRRINRRLSKLHKKMKLFSKMMRKNSKHLIGLEKRIKKSERRLKKMNLLVLDAVRESAIICKTKMNFELIHQGGLNAMNKSESMDSLSDDFQTMLDKNIFDTFSAEDEGNDAKFGVQSSAGASAVSSSGSMPTMMAQKFPQHHHNHNHMNSFQKIIDAANSAMNAKTDDEDEEDGGFDAKLEESLAEKIENDDEEEEEEAEEEKENVKVGGKIGADKSELSEYDDQNEEEDDDLVAKPATSMESKIIEDKDDEQREALKRRFKKINQRFKPNHNFFL